MKRWPSVRLTDVAAVNPSRPKEVLRLGDDHQVTFVPMPAVNQHLGTIEQAEIRPLSEVKKGFTYFAEGDVIFAKITPCMQNGKSAIARGLANGLGFGSTEFHVVRPNTDAVLAEWILHFLRQQTFRSEAIRHFRGAVGQQRVPAEYIENAVIPLPPLVEQRRIIVRTKECMERVEEIEALRSKAYAEAQAVLPSVLNEVFTSLSNSVPTMTIGDVAEETRYGTSQKCHSEATGTPILRIPNVAGGSVNFDKLKHCSLSKPDLKRIQLQAGDLLFVRTNGSRDLVGRCAVFDTVDVNQVYGFASYLIRVRLDKTRVLPQYLAYFLNSTNGRSELDKRRRTSAGQFNINSENLRSIPFPVPALSEQERLLHALRQRETQALQLTKTLEEAASETEFLREAILRKAFAGEL